MYNLFFTYDPDDYFLACIYVNLFSRSLHEQGVNVKEASLGAGYCNFVSVDDEFGKCAIKTLSLPGLTEEAVGAACEEVRRLLRSALEATPVRQLLQLQVLSIEDARDRLNHPISLIEMERYSGNIADESSFFLYKEGRAVESRDNLESVLRRKSGIEIPHEIFIPETGMYHSSLYAYAADAYDGRAIELLGKKVAERAEERAAYVAYETIIDPGHNLWVAFSFHKEEWDTVQEAMRAVTEVLESKGAPFGEGDNAAFKQRHALDWGVPFPENSRKALASSSCSFKKIGPEILVDWKW